MSAGFGIGIIELIVVGVVGLLIVGGVIAAVVIASSGSRSRDGKQ